MHCTILRNFSTPRCTDLTCGVFGVAHVDGGLSSRHAVKRQQRHLLPRALLQLPGELGGHLADRHFRTALQFCKQQCDQIAVSSCHTMARATHHSVIKKHCAPPNSTSAPIIGPINRLHTQKRSTAYTHKSMSSSRPTPTWHHHGHHAPCPASQQPQPLNQQQKASKPKCSPYTHHPPTPTPTQTKKLKHVGAAALTGCEDGPQALRQGAQPRLELLRGQLHLRHHLHGRLLALLKLKGSSHRLSLIGGRRCRAEGQDNKN